MEIQANLALLIFVIAYALIIWDKLHRTTVVMIAGVLVILLGIITQEKAIHHIDFNTLGLLIGMMIQIGITTKTGVFNYLAILSAKLAKGKPWLVLVFFSLLTAVLSALLDNVTTVLLITPVIFGVARKLKISPMPFLISEIIACNIGGASTLIGDPPNILIGSAVPALDYMAFIYNVAGISFFILFVTIALLVLIYRKELVTTDELRFEMMQMDEKKELKKPKLLIKCLIILGITTIGFALHQIVHLEMATVALTGAFILILLTTNTNEGMEKIFCKVEWPTLFFFLGLFVIVGALVETGVINLMAEKAIEYTKGDIKIAAFMILWMSAILSAFVENVPFVATMIPMIKMMGTHITHLDPLWWSLSLGTCLGANGTIIGASANLIVLGLAEQEGYHISFVKFMLIGFPLMVLSMLIASVYVYVTYLM